jgi:hypothetical protein
MAFGSLEPTPVLHVLVCKDGLLRFTRSARISPPITIAEVTRQLLFVTLSVGMRKGGAVNPV